MRPAKQRRPLPAPAARRGTRGAGRRGGAGTLWLLAAAFVWGAAATGFAIANYRTVQRLTEEAGLRQAAHDDKVRALTRRLVGVASHQVLEEEGLSGRLADIITRQVDLESRQALLAAMAERTLADKFPGEKPPLDKPANERAAPVPPAAAAEPAPGERARRRPEGRDAAPPAEGAPSGRPGRSGGLRNDPALNVAQLTALGARDQFGRIEASLGRVEAGQLRILTTLATAGRAAVERIRAVLAELPLSVSLPAAPLPPSPGPRDSFVAAVAQAEGALAESNRWRMAVDSLPLLAPIEGGAGLTSNFGMRSDPFTGGARMHAGMDFRSPVGTPVRAAASGRVVTAGPSGGYGNLVEIEHGRDVVTRYGHLSSIGVTVDQTVAAGAPIGLVGSTGRSTGPHLHYETRLAAGPVDPARFIGAGRTLFGATATAADGVSASHADPQSDAPADASD
ncbi:M23 family metallopeptidase [Methylobacterium sp. J-068]|uniref:M23 family metallopeptidase n=1 Tax=Methylobacterium sp. J-068 TaxID=2836649 RepID=UPI001FBB5E7B|nr:M23 family metallopeptidase [Methylobacterium sp. J-068]MCJ2033851.1 M23 family metallopeptidase [Methylobacterium sp. J-068]